MKQILTIGDFERVGEPGSFQHYFRHKLPDGGEICLEACLEGYDVARYDSNLMLIGKKTCTKIPGMMEAQIAPGFSVATGEALLRAIEIANKKYA